MRAIDTNVLVRLIVRDDPKQVAAAEKFVAHGALVSTLVLAEAVWVLGSVYELTSEQLAGAVEMLVDHQDLTLQDGDVVRAALERFRANPLPGLTDCLVLEIARKAGHLPLGTFDRRLSQLEGTQLLSTPKGLKRPADRSSACGSPD